MSCTTILCLTPLGVTPEAVKELKELHNSHGSAPVIWDAMCQKYFRTEPYAYMHDGTLEKLWPIYKDKSIPEHQRAVLMMTYDCAYVSKPNYERAASDIRKWLKEFPPKNGYVNHWDEIGLQCTSVTENPFHGEWCEELDEYLPLDWDDAFEIYSELDSLT